MLAKTRVKLRSAESSIAFMQEQHARTLEGLHQEIQKLQQKNARLTFELAMKGSCSTGPSDYAECKRLEEELEAAKDELLSLRSTLSSCEDKINLLEHQIAEMGRKCAEEIKNRDTNITQLNAELEEKSITIAHLTQQLHHSKVRLKQALERTAHMHTEVTDPSSDLQHGTIPPEADNARRTGIRRRVRRTTSSPVPQEVASFPHDTIPDMRTRLHLPAPPISPRPPSSSPPHPLLRRASTPLRRQSPSPETTSYGDLINRHQLPTPPRPPSTSRKALDPVQLHRRGPPPPNICDILHSHDREVQVVTKPAPPVLPPIRSDTSMLTHRRAETTPHSDVVPSHSVECTSYSESPPRTTYPHQHRHFILAKSQGLSSAPSALRVLRYSSRELEGGAEASEVGETAEGMLMVKENVTRKEQAWQELHQHDAN